MTVHCSPRCLKVNVSRNDRVSSKPVILSPPQADEGPPRMLTPNMHLRGSLANCLDFGEGAIPAAFQSEILRETLRQNPAQDDTL